MLLVYRYLSNGWDSILLDPVDKGWIRPTCKPCQVTQLQFIILTGQLGSYQLLMEIVLFHPY